MVCGKTLRKSSTAVWCANSDVVSCQRICPRFQVEFKSTSCAVIVQIFYFFFGWTNTLVDFAKNAKLPGVLLHLLTSDQHFCFHANPGIHKCWIHIGACCKSCKKMVGKKNIFFQVFSLWSYRRWNWFIVPYLWVVIACWCQSTDQCVRSNAPLSVYWRLNVELLFASLTLLRYRCLISTSTAHKCAASVRYESHDNKCLRVNCSIGFSHYTII